MSLDDRWNGPEGLKEPGNYFSYSTGNPFMGFIFNVKKSISDRLHRMPSSAFFSTSVLDPRKVSKFSQND